MIEGDFAQTGVHVEVLMDDMLYASYTSSKVRSKHTVFNQSESAISVDLSEEDLHADARKCSR